MKIRKVCATCESADVRSDAWASWNELTQEWELYEFFVITFANLAKVAVK